MKYIRVSYSYVHSTSVGGIREIDYQTDKDDEKTITAEIEKEKGRLQSLAGDYKVGIYSWFTIKEPKNKDFCYKL